jgi:hypothetical protein
MVARMTISDGELAMGHTAANKMKLKKRSILYQAKTPKGYSLLSIGEIGKIKRLYFDDKYCYSIKTRLG